MRCPSASGRNSARPASRPTPWRPGGSTPSATGNSYPNVNYDEEIKKIAVRRIGKVTDIAAACVYLASDGAGYISGQVIHANGGWHMY